MDGLFIHHIYAKGFPQLRAGYYGICGVMEPVERHLKVGIILQIGFQRFLMMKDRGRSVSMATLFNLSASSSGNRTDMGVFM